MGTEKYCCAQEVSQQLAERAAVTSIFIRFDFLSCLPDLIQRIHFYSFLTSPYLPPLLKVERTSIALNADDVL